MGLGSHTPAPDERRAAVRHATSLSGRVIVGDALHAAECVIVDLSDTGARIHFALDARLGPPLSLLFIRDGRLVDAVVAWRRGSEAGLVFRGEHDLAKDTHPNRRRIRELWQSLRSRPSAA